MGASAAPALRQRRLGLCLTPPGGRSQLRWCEGRAYVGDQPDQVCLATRIGLGEDPAEMGLERVLGDIERHGGLGG